MSHADPIVSFPAEVSVICSYDEKPGVSYQNGNLDGVTLFNETP
jgi:hypothetical protein